MFYMLERTETPLQDLDVGAWLALSQITGDLPLPSAEEIKRFNMNTLLDSLNDPMFRYESDWSYKEQWMEKCPEWPMQSRRMREMSRKFTELQYRVLARDALDAGYPVQFGTYEKLNKTANALVSFCEVGDYARYDLSEDSPDASWRTFRDCNPSKCYSIFTGRRSVPLKKHWLDLDSHEIADIVDHKSTNGSGKSGFFSTIGKLLPGRKNKILP